MERSRTIENTEIRNGTVPNNGKNGIREWNDPAQWKKWDRGMERSRTMKNMEIWEWNVWKFGNGTVPHNEKYGNLGMERSRTMECMEI